MQSILELNRLRHEAVRLRLEGCTLAETRAATGLSVPTIVAATRCYQDGGWSAVDVRRRGRKPGPGPTAGSDPLLDGAFGPALFAAMQTSAPEQLWDIERVQTWLAERSAQPPLGPGRIRRALNSVQMLPSSPYRQWRDSRERTRTEWIEERMRPFSRRARRQGQTVLWVQERRLVEQKAVQWLAWSLRGRCAWQLHHNQYSTADAVAFLNALAEHWGTEVALVTESDNPLARAALGSWQRQRPEQRLWLRAPCAAEPNTTSTVPPAGVRPETALSRISSHTEPERFSEDTSMSSSHAATTAKAESTTGRDADRLTHLQRLEAESIHIMREVVAEADNPVMLYSIGKDSAVMLHLAAKAFYPAPPPFPLLHVDTTWKFKAMYELRDRMSAEHNFELLVYSNEEGIKQGINPFTHGSEIHTDIMKTQALKQALDKYGFDVAFGGARRDEEKSRAKERIFSFRSANHRWEPKNQRPELWHLYNARKHKNESIRVFPLSNWTELDIWQYIHQQDIPIVPLYYSDIRPVVERDGTLIMVDDERMPLREGETPMMKSVRFRTLGCYPLTGAVESTAATLPEIIQEMLLTRTSERSGRLIDHDTAASMEKKKQEGYF